MKRNEMETKIAFRLLDPLLECYVWTPCIIKAMCLGGGPSKNVLINPQRACGARVTVVGLSVCVSVCY